MQPPSNDEIARVFLAIGDLMDYRDENAFKVRSYWRVAEMLLGLTEPLADVCARGGLDSLPGVGAAIAGKMGEILDTGTCDLYERLKREVAPGIQALLGVPGLTPRIVRILEQERGVTDPTLLEAAVEMGLEGVPNLGAADRAAILRALVSMAGEDERAAYVDV